MDNYNQISELAHRIETAARHFYACKQRQKELQARLAQAEADTKEADKRLAQLMPYCIDAQVLSIPINSDFPLVIRVVGEPELRGEDCYLLEAYTTRTAAAEVLNGDTAPLHAEAETVGAVS